MVVPHGDPDYYARARQHRDRAARSRATARRDHRPRRLLRPAPGAGAAQAALGRPAPRRSCTRAARPTRRARTSTRRTTWSRGRPASRAPPTAGWRAGSGRAAGPRAASPFRAVALGPRAAARSLRGDAGAVAMSSVADFDVKRWRGHAAGGVDARQRLRVALRAGRARPPPRHRPRDLRGGQDAQGARAPQRLAPANGAAVSARALRREPAADRPAHQGRRRPRDRLRRRGRLGHPRGPGHRARAARATGSRSSPRASPRSPAISATAWRDVVVLTMSEFGRTVARERQPRHRSRPRAPRCSSSAAPCSGGRVYGRWPGLAREQLFEGRDLAVTTDFRSLFAEVAVRHLGAPAAPLFPGFSAPTGAWPGVLG